MSGERTTMPPVRLPSEAELAREALAAPLYSRAVRLARWSGPRIPVGVTGTLLEKQLNEAVAHLGLADDDTGPADADDAWRFAVDTGLVELVEADAEDVPGGEAGPVGEDGTPVPVPAYAEPGQDAEDLLTSGSPHDVLEIWLDGLEGVLADACAPDLEDLLDGIAEGGEPDLDELDWDADEEAAFLDGVLGNLYLLTALEDEAGERAVPLPALAASVIVPDDMDEPTDDVLEEVSTAMMRLDDQFRLLAPIGFVEYRPMDEALVEEIGDDRDGADAAALGDEEDITRYGMVRLTPLGVYGMRSRMLDAGVEAPAVGDLSDKGADVLLDRLPHYPESAARAEVELWVARRDAASAARELLAAGRGDDESAPLRRLGCQQALSLVGREAEPALREVLDDPHLGGLARVWLTENGAADVPEPPQDMVFWLTVDTIAAQLTAQSDSAELRELVQGLVSGHSGFFDTVWRVDHPATADVLEAMGRLHPDRAVAKEARKAAFKARSRHGG
ncbi:hypothetical protein [Streptomyces meridianus]|uniref:Uncharacterized protein n=1 Tax=Streptomyces meridianus TaxID=2938945 RepID=A0ABT0X5L7_9ACTN|nr:hypothetical protein [Streptomyces meridianus]MCM2577550.1 hypothetical protein [Streptomyces meridianus]